MRKLWFKPGPQLLFYSIVVVLFAISLQMKPLSLSSPQLDASAPDILESAIDVPNFNEISNIALKKKTFFDFLQPYIDNENENILAQRESLQYLYQRLLLGQSLNHQEYDFLVGISKMYKVKVDKPDRLETIRELLSRVDVIPSSLVLSQGANESAWGTSRFAREGNNFFGQWCYSKGCGIIPSRRGANDVHEVTRYDSVADSIHSYFMNINTFSSYDTLRSIRLELRLAGNEIDGISLSEGLSEYSARGTAYIYELQSMIHSNNLLQRDEA